MRSFTRTAILKSNTVEILSPCLLENPKPEKKYRSQAAPVEFSVVSLPFSEQDVPVKQQDPYDLIAEAEKEAAEIIAKAKKQAEIILQNAQAESEALKEKVAETVRAEVMPLAKAEGYQKGLQEAQSKAEEIMARAKAYLEMARKVLQQEYEKVDEQLVKLSIRIAEKVLNCSLQHDPQILLHVLRNIVQMPLEKDTVVLHLSNKDLQWYSELPEQDKLPYPVVADETLKCGDVLLECSEGIFDARIDTQLERLERYLLEELKHGELAEANSESR